MSKYCWWISWVLVCWTVLLVRGQEPDITERILPEIKRMGVTGRLKCVVINQQDNQVAWIQKSTQTKISSDDKIVIDDAHNVIVNGWPKYQIEKTKDGQKNIYTIIVNRLEPRDSGNYTCQVIVRGTTRFPSKDGEMIVLVPPAISRAHTTHTISVKEFGAVNLTCAATGFPTPNITWVRINGEVLPSGELKHRAPVFPISPVTKASRGVYRCLADNNVRPPASSDATVLVLFKPESRPVQDSYGQAQNRMFDVTIECRVSGWPEPDLKWYKDPMTKYGNFYLFEQRTEGGTLQQISNDDKHTINILLNHANVLEPNERWLQMVIRSVQANDYGVYVCEGRNDLGTGTADVKLFETSECQGPNCPPEQVFINNASPPSLLSNVLHVLSLLLLSILFTLE